MVPSVCEVLLELAVAVMSSLSVDRVCSCGLTVESPMTAKSGGGGGEGGRLEFAEAQRILVEVNECVVCRKWRVYSRYIVYSALQHMNDEQEQKDMQLVGHGDRGCRISRSCGHQQGSETSKGGLLDSTLYFVPALTMGVDRPHDMDLSTGTVLRSSRYRTVRRCGGQQHCHWPAGKFWLLCISRWICGHKSCILTYRSILQ